MKLMGASLGEATTACVRLLPVLMFVCALSIADVIAQQKEQQPLQQQRTIATSHTEQQTQSNQLLPVSHARFLRLITKRSTDEPTKKCTISIRVVQHLEGVCAKVAGGRSVCQTDEYLDPLTPDC